jgi:hypothetical protein
MPRCKVIDSGYYLAKMPRHRKTSKPYKTPVIIIDKHNKGLPKDWRNRIIGDN